MLLEGLEASDLEGTEAISEAFSKQHVLARDKFTRLGVEFPINSRIILSCAIHQNNAGTTEELMMRGAKVSTMPS